MDRLTRDGPPRGPHRGWGGRLRGRRRYARRRPRHARRRSARAGPPPPRRRSAAEHSAGTRYARRKLRLSRLAIASTTWQRAELLHHPEIVAERPVLRDLPVRDAEDVHELYGHLLPRR